MVTLSGLFLFMGVFGSINKDGSRVKSREVMGSLLKSVLLNLTIGGGGGEVFFFNLVFVTLPGLLDPSFFVVLDLAVGPDVLLLDLGVVGVPLILLLLFAQIDESSLGWMAKSMSAGVVISMLSSDGVWEVAMVVI